MNMQQSGQQKPPSNAFGRRRVDREMFGRQDNKLHPGMSTSNLNNAGPGNAGRAALLESPSRDRLLFMTTCLRGHRVEAQVKDGSVYCGILHAANMGKDIGIVLKMACQTKEGSPRGQMPISDFVSKAPLRTLIIPPKDLVQVIAKDTLITGEGLSNGHTKERQLDIMIDSHISQPHRIDAERELERWTPDKDDPQCPELENIFDGTWNSRNWDQFEANEKMFGVKSTFNEELYTTKLERGPQTREIEKKALRIAKEIESEETQDLHLSEERGTFHGDFDEESRFSSVFRGVDDGSYDESEDVMLNEYNSETFGVASVLINSQSLPDEGKSIDVPQASSNDTSLEVSSSRTLVDIDAFFPVSRNQDEHVNTDCSSSLSLDGECRVIESQPRVVNGGKCSSKDLIDTKNVIEESQTSKPELMHSSLNTKKQSFDEGRLSPSATAYAPLPSKLAKGQESWVFTRESSENTGSGNDASQPINAHVRPSTSDGVCPVAVSSRPGLSPSSSMGSISSEKSSLNPYAKEFKLNPNAKSFTPSLTSLKPPPPASESQLFFPSPHMHGLSVGVGVGPSVGGQPVIYNTSMTPMQSHQMFVHPNGPMYGQQVILGQPRPVIYLPTYPPEMQYRGRDF